MRLPALLLILAFLIPPAASNPPDPVQLVSVRPQGGSGGGFSYRPAISADGSLVAFTSNAPDLVPSDNNGAWDVFVRDQATGQTTRVSVSSAGMEARGHSGYWSSPSLSADGRLVAFSSTASNLAAGDTNQAADVFVHDRQTGQTELISRGLSGSPGAGWSDWPALSPDGRYVSFTSLAHDLVDGDRNNRRDIFLFDRQEKSMERISVPTEGGQSSADAGWASAVSAGGGQVVFSSPASDLVPGDTNGAWDVFVRDRDSGRTLRVSVSSRAEQGNGGSGYWSSLGISADGSTVAFQSSARNLVRGDHNGVIDVFVHDWRLAQTWRVSLNPDGNETGLDCVWPAISPDGRYVAFTCAAANLVKEDTNAQWDVFVRDRINHHTTRVSISESGGQAAQPSGYWTAAALSDQAEWVAYASFDPNLAGPDSNNGWDVIAARVPYLRGLDIVREARTTAGMPYCPRPEPDYRGCPREDAEEGCGGPYFGFRCGVCTDLVMDAYREGSGYDLGYALWADVQAHPDRRYVWNDARSAQDMWLYFRYNGGVLTAETAFLPGDIAFFDWEKDGVIDHVGIVTQVDAAGQPQAIIEALGTIASNPDGLARELRWQKYHHDAFTGHAR